MEYPAELNYNNINPKGFFSAFKEWKIEPIANSGQFWPGENIKILIQSLFNGVMDPYRSHFEIVVDCEASTLPVGLLQVDSSAQSFIEQLVISSRNREIERIPEYSVLAAWLTDIGLPEMYAEGRQTEGLGFVNTSTHSSLSGQAYSNYVGAPQTSGANGAPIEASGLIFPTQLTGILNKTGFNATLAENIPKTYACKNTQGHVGSSNFCWESLMTLSEQAKYINLKGANYNTLAKASLNETGYFKNLRAEYATSIQEPNFPDSTTSKQKKEVVLNKSLFLNNDGTMKSEFTFATGDEYKIEFPDTFSFNIPLLNGTDAVKTVPNNTRLHGFSNLYCPDFCRGTHEPFISPTVPQGQMRNGVLEDQKFCITKRTFKIPLISAIIGVLIPEDQFVLLPIKALNELLIETVIDKYAMFTSGYNDISEMDTEGIKIMQNRAFRIKEFSYNMHTYQFYDPKIDEYLNKALSDRILLNCNMWTLGNQYTLQKGDHVTNNWPVACTSEALNEVVCLFLSTHYQKKSFCRKHFRLSNNVTKFQLRINMEYFPPQPIVGNGGNPNLNIGVDDDNSNFIEQIFWSNNYMFNKVTPLPRINANNFAINRRCYDVNMQKAMYEDFYKQSPTTYTWNSESVNYDTAMGMPWIHENRFVGRAGYTFSFEPYAHSAYHLVGLDCRNIRQFDALMTVDATNPYPEDEQLFIFTRSSVIIQYTDKGIEVFGR